MLTRRLSSLVFGVVVFGIASVSYSVIPDCDGSSPKDAMCGEASSCTNSGYSLTPQSCPGHQIYRLNGQFACTDPAISGVGSTLCGPADPENLAVCTSKKGCVQKSSYKDYPSGTYLVYWCEGSGTAQANSVKNQTDLIICRDTI